MLNLITAPFLPSMPSAGDRTTPRTSLLEHDLLALAIGCVAAAGIAVGLYLAAPAAWRDGMVAAFLGLDQPTMSAPAPRPPLL
jgi:hypothetical protein